MISLLSLHSAIVRYWNQYKLKKLKFRYFGTNIKICPNFKLGHTENLILHDNIVLGENIFINAQGWSGNRFWNYNWTRCNDIFGKSYL